MTHDLTHNDDMTTPEREEIAARLEAEIRPLIENDKYDDPPGYNCCGCSTYDAILDHAIRIVRDEPAEATS